MLLGFRKLFIELEIIFEVVEFLINIEGVFNVVVLCIISGVLLYKEGNRNRLVVI